MARCHHCNHVILFGGQTDRGRRFCNQKCKEAMVNLDYYDDIPDEIVRQRAMQLRDAKCPICGGDGPNDFHTATRVISIFVMTTNHPTILFGCHSCGTSMKLKTTLTTLFLGWWGFPWGLIQTPLVTLANIRELFRGERESPSQQLHAAALEELAENLRHRVEHPEWFDDEAAATERGAATEVPVNAVWSAGRGS